jgi:2-polyprenyl-3-methyl-5-hydroxy-6-metoxy-1,4-benzoquinol methylase
LAQTHWKYWKEIIPFLETFQKTFPLRSWDEQAIPSYVHPIAIVRKVFWKRVFAAMNVAKNGESALDFGCGAGATFPWLHRKYKFVTAIDSDPKSQVAAREICQKMSWTNINVLSETTTESIPTESLDTIIALDVLEHVDDLPKLLLEFKRILKQDGVLIVSSPTENFTYKLVRKFAGPGYQGEYHLRAAKEVESDLAQVFKVKLKKRIFPIFTFFRIVTASK